MSHITDVDNSIFVTDLFCLKQAIEKFCPDLEFVEGQTHYRTWKDNHNGKLVGDWPLPKGWTAEQVGENAVHVIRVKEEYLEKLGVDRNDGRAPYEIGIVPMRVTRDEEGNVIESVPDPNGNEYTLMTDWWANGNGILKCKNVGMRKKVKDDQTGEERESAFDQLYKRYREMEIIDQCEQNGDTVTHYEELPDGSLIIETDTKARLGM